MELIPIDDTGSSRSSEVWGVGSSGFVVDVDNGSDWAAGILV